MAYDANALYAGKIVGQLLTNTRDGDPQLRLSVELTGKFKGRNPDDGVAPIADEDKGIKTVYFNFRPSPENLERVFRDLRNLGLTSPNIEVFDLEHPKALKLQGTPVTLKCRFSDDQRGGQKDWWNLTFAAPRAPKISNEAIKKFRDINGSSLLNAFERSGEPKAEKVPN